MIWPNHLNGRASQPVSQPASELAREAPIQPLIVSVSSFSLPLAVITLLADADDKSNNNNSSDSNF